MQNKFDMEMNLKQKLQESEDQISRLKLLIEINTYIANSLEKEVVLKRILQQVEGLLGCESGSILLVDRDIDKLRFAILSRDDDGILKGTSLSRGEGIAGTVWSNGIPVLIRDVQNDPRFSDRADKKSKNMTRSLIAVPLTVDGEVIGVVEAMNKVDGFFSEFDLLMLQYISTQSAIAIKNADLYDMAIRDGMTRLFINKYFKERLAEELSRAKRYSHSLSLLIFDIDHFKRFNDNYGHLAGDSILREVASIIQENCRAEDIPARYGGEEFTIILPETSSEDARSLAQRIRKKVKENYIEINGEVLCVTVSGGYVSIPESNAENVMQFIEMADRALYHSKNNGRDMVSGYKTDM